MESYVRDPHTQARLQATLASERVARERNKETHLHQSQLEEEVGERIAKNSHPHSSLESRIKPCFTSRQGELWENEDSRFSIPVP